MSATETPSQPSASARRASRLSWPQAAAWALVVLGGLLLAANLGLLQPQARQVVWLMWAAVLMLAGLWLMAGRPRGLARAADNFAVARGEFDRATLAADSGAVDLRLHALASASELAAGEYDGQREPRLEIENDEAVLRIDARHVWSLPGGAAWPVALSPRVLWVLQLASDLGDFQLDLTHLQLAALRLRSTFGQVDLTLPAAGAASLDLDLVFGDLTLQVPDGMAVKLKLRAGPLSNFVHDERRFVQLAPDEWATPLYAVAANRCTLTVRLWAGDLDLR